MVKRQVQVSVEKVFVTDFIVFCSKHWLQLFFLFDNMRLMSVSGIPSQKPKEQQRSVLRPAVLQAPPSKSHLESSKQLKSLSSRNK